MIVKIFKTNYPVQVIIFVVSAILLWMHGLLSPLPVDTSHLTRLQFALLRPFAAVPFVGVVTALSLTMVEALVFNQLLAAKEFVQRNTLMPAFLFLLVFSHGPHLLQVNALTFAIPFLLLLLMLMLHLPDASELYVTLFFASFTTTVASFFYPPAIFFLAFIWISFIVNGIFSWREWVISLLGGVMPVFLTWSWLFLTDSPPLLTSLMWPQFANPLHLETWPDIPEIIVSSLIAILFLAAFRHHLSSLLENVLSFRQKVWNLTWFTLFGIGSSLFAGPDFFNHLALVSIPAVAFIAGWLLTRRRQRWVNILMLMLFVLVFLQNQGIL